MFKLDGSPLPSIPPAFGSHLHHLARSDRETSIPPGQAVGGGVLSCLKRGPGCIGEVRGWKGRDHGEKSGYAGLQAM